MGPKRHLNSPNSSSLFFLLLFERLLVFNRTTFDQRWRICWSYGPNDKSTHDPSCAISVQLASEPLHKLTQSTWWVYYRCYFLSQRGSSLFEFLFSRLKAVRNPPHSIFPLPAPSLMPLRPRTNPHPSRPPYSAPPPHLMQVAVVVPCRRMLT